MEDVGAAFRAALRDSARANRGGMMSYHAMAYFRHEHAEHPVVVGSDREMDDLIDRLLAESFENSIATLHIVERPLNAAGVPDHQMSLAINAADNVAGIRYQREQVWYSKGDTDSKREDVFYYYMGSDTDYPRDSEISILVLRDAAKEFLRTGGDRPTSVPWQENPWR
jgi:hypothetical protein